MAITLTTEHHAKFKEFLDATGTKRAAQLNTLFKKYGKNRLMDTPASGYTQFHNAHKYGWYDHIIRVCEHTVTLWDMWEKNKLQDGYELKFTREQAVFCAMMHDLYKLGFPGGEPWYLENPSDWHKKNQGKLFVRNQDITWTNGADFTMFILQQEGIQIELVEMLGIRLADGMYDEAAVPYYMKFDAGDKIKCTLPYLIHQADILAYLEEHGRDRP